MPVWLEDGVVREYLDPASKLGALMQEYATGDVALMEHVELHQALVERFGVMRATSEAVEGLHGQYSRILHQARAIKLASLSTHVMCSEKNVCTEEDFLRFDLSEYICFGI